MQFITKPTKATKPTKPTKPSQYSTSLLPPHNSCSNYRLLNMDNNPKWPVFNSKLINRFLVAEGTMSFCFERPKSWDFKPGQFLDITLIDPPETDAEGNTRGFSISSAPYEDHIMVTTRLRDTAFKRVLSTVPLGYEAKLEGPFGNFTLHNNSKRAAVFVSGGIGITPVRSILYNAAKEKLPHHIFLLFFNHTPESAPFIEELMNLQSENPNFKMVATMTDMEKSQKKWTGHVGKLTKELINDTVGSEESPIFYISGPADMVKGVRTLLNSCNVDDDDIRTEEFSGY